MNNILVLGITICFMVITSLQCESNRGNDAAQQLETSHSPAFRSGHSGGATLPAGELDYTVPKGWEQEQPSSQMRKGQFSLPGSEGAESAEMAIFFFPGQGGPVEANLMRWYGQFRAPDGKPISEPVEKQSFDVNGIPVTIVYVIGTYLQAKSPAMMGGPVEEMTEYAMLAAIAETANGPWFFKTTGPQKTIEYWRTGFDEFVQSFHIRK